MTVEQLAEAVAIVLDDPMERRGMTRRESVPMVVPPLRIAA